MGQMVLPSLPFEDELLFICFLSAPHSRESHSLITTGTTEAHQETTWGQIKGGRALHTPWCLSATPPLNHYYKTPHWILSGWDTLSGAGDCLSPLLSGKAIRLILFCFTQNCVSKTWFGIGAQRLSFQHQGWERREMQWKNEISEKGRIEYNMELFNLKFQLNS